MLTGAHLFWHHGSENELAWNGVKTELGMSAGLLRLPTDTAHCWCQQQHRRKHQYSLCLRLSFWRLGASLVSQPGQQQFMCKRMVLCTLSNIVP